MSISSIFDLLPQAKLLDLPQVCMMLASQAVFLLSYNTLLTKCQFLLFLLVLGSAGVELIVTRSWLG